MKKQLLNIKGFVHNINLSRGDKNEVLTENLITAEKRVDLIKQTCQNTEKKLSACLQTSGTGGDFEKRLKKLPTIQLFQCFSEFSEQLGLDTVLGQTLFECSKLQNALSKEMLQNEIDIEEHCINDMKKIIEDDIPNVTKARKHLNKATTDMEAVRFKYHTAIKQSQSNGPFKIEALKKEVEDASLKVDQTKDSFATEVFSLLSKESDYAEVFVKLFRLQANYYGKMHEVFKQFLPILEKVVENTIQKPVFGTPLEEHLRVTGRDISIVIEVCIGWLLNNLNEEGLFRIPGSLSKVKKLKSAFDAGIIDFDEYARDSHTIAGTLKSYFRELPEHLFTYSLYPEWINAAKISDTDKRLQALWSVCEKLPKANLENLKYFIKFLSKIANNSDNNKMSSHNLAIAISPSLIWAPHSDSQLDINMASGNHHSIIIDSLINYADLFFPGDVSFVIFPNIDKSINGHSYSETSSSNNKPSLVHRHAKKQAPPAPISFQKLNNDNDSDKDTSSSPDQESNFLTNEATFVDKQDSSDSSVLFSSGSLDRNKPKVDNRVTRQLSYDKKPLNYKNIVKPTFSPPSIPKRSSERPVSVYEKSFIRPERPQRACDLVKVKQRSLENLTEIQHNEEHDLNKSQEKLFQTSAGSNSINNSNENLIMINDEKNDDQIKMMNDNQKIQDKDMLTELNRSNIHGMIDRSSDEEDQSKPPMKPPRASTPSTDDVCLRNTCDLPVDTDTDTVTDTVNSYLDNSFKPQMKPPRPQPPGNKPKLNSSGEKTYL